METVQHIKRYSMRKCHSNNHLERCRFSKLATQERLTYIANVQVRQIAGQIHKTWWFLWLQTST